MIIKRTSLQTEQSGELSLYDVHELVDSLDFLSFSESIEPYDNDIETNEEYIEHFIKQQQLAKELNENGQFEEVVKERNESTKEFTMSIDGVTIPFKLVNNQILTRCDFVKYDKQLFQIADAVNATLYDSVGMEIKRRKKGLLSFFGI
ncbi:hypothetical protein RFS42_004396 [Vibrio vulnificus]|uniref:hypothetical protein n=1 Tax=Vibrio vulnificus TaxID=672 RepID=UPI000CD15D1C|nr:hypothetical protein [Vibrio vulnificus]EHU4978625.1 hypothetical protein [Vibrio vulnificus]ELA4932564.1 hypothetical protein [Vibrio vulnificus]EMA2414862.1 hypothetical protein [Vibrio vulnificus]MCG8706710.1 hypothetical protein [Vibrio vulnificus]MCU8448056.1 hypothetical protein [Vibrio vulnificus]